MDIIYIIKLFGCITIVLLILAIPFIFGACVEEMDGTGSKIFGILTILEGIVIFCYLNSIIA